MALHDISGNDFSSLTTTDANSRPHIVANLNNQALVEHIKGISAYDGFLVHDESMPKNIVVTNTESNIETMLLRKTTPQS